MPHKTCFFCISFFILLPPQQKTAARAVEPFCCGFSVLQDIFYWNSKVNFIYLPSDSQKVPLTSLQFFSA